MRGWITAVGLVCCAGLLGACASGGVQGGGGVAAQDTGAVAADSGVQDAANTADGGAATDADQGDAGPADAAKADAASADAAKADAAKADAGSADAGISDSATSDAGTTDATSADAGSADAASSDAGAPDVGSPDVGTPDAGTPDAVGQDTTAQQGKGAALPWPPLVEPAAFGGELRVACEAHDAQGAKLADPGDWQITVAGGPGTASAKGDAWTIDKPGSYTVTCSSAKAQVVVSAPLEVAHAGLDPGLTRMAAELSDTGTLVAEVLAKTQDTPAQKAAIAKLADLSKTVGAGLEVSASAVLPLPKGLPDVAAAKAKGAASGPDDAAWGAQLTKVEAALVALASALKAAKPGKLQQAQWTAIEAAFKAYDTERAALAKLKPSPLGVLEHKAALDKVALTWLPKVARLHAKLLAGELQAVAKAAPPPPCPTCFSLVGLSVSIGVQYALSAVPSYTGLLKDMGWAIGQMVTMLVIKDLVDTKFPPASQGPSIIAISGLGQAATPGMHLSIMASGFGNQPGECSVIFLTPALSKTIVDGIKLAAGGIPKLKDLKSKSAWEAAKAVKSAIDQVKATAELLTGGIPTMLESGIVLMPSQSGSQFMDMGIIKLGVVPKKANCGWVPQPGVLVPFCATTGAGATFSITVIGKKC